MIRPDRIDQFAMLRKAGWEKSEIKRLMNINEKLYLIMNDCWAPVYKYNPELFEERRVQSMKYEQEIIAVAKYINTLKDERQGLHTMYKELFNAGRTWANLSMRVVDRLRRLNYIIAQQEIQFEHAKSAIATSNPYAKFA